MEHNPGQWTSDFQILVSPLRSLDPCPLSPRCSGSIKRLQHLPNLDARTPKGRYYVQSRILNSMTFIHLEDYTMINDIEANIISSMNLPCSSMSHTSVKLAKTTDWLWNIISSEVMRTQSSKLHIRRWNAFFIYYIYIARIMIIYNSLKYTRHYHLYLSSCLALLIINKESYCLILRFVINHSSHALMWWINSMRSFWSHLLISSWLHMFKFCKNVFFMFFAWDEICELKLFNHCILTKLQSIYLWKRSSSARSWSYFCCKL